MDEPLLEVQKSPEEILLSKLLTDEMFYMEKINKLLVRLSESPVDNKERKGLLNSVYILIKKFVENRYGPITRLEPRVDSVRETFNTYLQLVPFYFDKIITIQPLPTEVVYYLWSKTLSCCLCHLVFQRRGGTLQQNLYMLLTKYLNKEDRMEFVVRTIRELDGLVSGNNKLCFTSPGEFHTVVEVDTLNRETMIIILVELLQHMPNFDYKDLKDYDLYRLWKSLLAAYLLKNIQIRKISVQLCHRLLQQDFGNFMCWRMLFHRIFSMELLVAKNRRLYANVEMDGDSHSKMSQFYADVETIRGSHSSILQELSSNLLLFHQHSSLNGIDVNTVLTWAHRFASLCDEYYTQRKPEYLEKVVWCCCDVLSRYDGVFQYESKYAQVTELIQNFTVMELSSYSLNDQSTERLTAYISFLLTVDDMFHKNDQYLKIKEAIVSKAKLYHSLSTTSEITTLLTWNKTVMTILNQCDSDRSKDLIDSCLPDKDLLFTLVSKAASECSGELMLAVIQIVGDLSNYSEKCQELAVDFLIFPWLSLISPADLKRKIPTMSVLSQLYKLVSKSSIVLTNKVREGTLVPLTTISKSIEWRTKIFALALNSEDISVKQTALKQLPSLILSSNTILDIMLPVFFDMQHERSILAPFLASIASSICAASGHLRSGYCSYCTSKDKQYPSDNLLDINVKEFPRLLMLLQEIFDNAPRLQVDVKQESVSLLLALLNHVHFPTGSLNALLQASFCLCIDVDLEVRNEYRIAFEIVIKHSIFVGLSAENMRPLEAYKREELDKGLALAEAASSFFVVFIRFSADESLREWAFAEHLNIILQFYDSNNLKLSMSNVVKQIAAVESPYSDATVVFARRIRKFSAILMSDLIECTKQMQMGNEVDEEICNALDNIFGLVCQLFQFGSYSELIRISAKYMVAELFRIGVRKPTAVRFIIRRMASHLKVKMQKLGYEVIPMLLAQAITTKMDVDAQLVDTVFGLKLNDCLLGRRYHCNLYCLLVISHDEVTTLNVLNEINKRVFKDNFSLTKMLNVNCEYLGILLSIRRALLDDEFFEMRSTLLKSLHTFIMLLDQEFVDEVAHKFMAVLRAATYLGKDSVPVWTAFIRILSTRMLANLLPQILIAIQSLLEYEDTNDLLDYIFKFKKPLTVEHSASFERTALVLWRPGSSRRSKINSYLQQTVKDHSRERVIAACIIMLTEECETVGKVVLEKLISILDGTPLTDANLTAELVPALLLTLRKCSELEVRSLAASCLARVGAIDPGRLSVKSPTKSAGTQLVFMDNNTQFFVYLIERCWRVYSNVLDAQVIDQVELCLQELLKRLVGSQDVHSIMSKLDRQCVCDIEPLCKSSLNPIQIGTISPVDHPFVDHVDNFNDWLRHCFFSGTESVRQQVMLSVFRSLIWIVNTGDTVFTRELLPHLIIRLIIESNVDMLLKFFVEMSRVLQRVVDGESGWIQMAAHVVFSIIDTLERFVYHRINKKGKYDEEGKRAEELVQRMFAIKLDNGALLVVAAAEKCHCFHRALRWCEQYGIKNDNDGNYDPDRRDYYILERIHTHLHNVDGVLGAYEALASKHTPSADERILALEANGDYHESLPLYSQSTDHKEIKLIKCLLRLNQPELALSIAVTQYSQLLDGDDSTTEALEASQLEAAWLLKDWSRLDRDLQASDPLLSGKHVSWGSACASIMHSLRSKDKSALDIRLKAAREGLVQHMTAMTIEQTDIYSQVYKYIAQLHILEEVEDAALHLDLLVSSSQNSKELRPLLTKWQTRSDSVMQCSSILEPILRVRRELLLSCETSGSKNAVSQLFVQSCRLARQAGHLQIAWTFLVEAKALNVNYKEVGMEEARYEFQKGNQQQAIGLLTKLLNGQFARANELFSTHIASTDVKTEFSVEIARRTTKEERTSFAEVHLLRAEYMMKSGAVSSNELYKIYIGLTRLAVQSEDLFYRVAVFCDGMYSSDNPNIRQDMINQIVNIYGQVLKFGDSHLFHAMPRMLTLWLDVTQKKTEDIVKRNEGASPMRAELNAKDENCIDTLSEDIREIYKQLSSQKFYTAFQQLISRIVHPSDRVFATLKIILADLLVKFPHQCLWQAISVYRTGPWKDNLRQERCTQVFDVARRKHGVANSSLSGLITQYDYIAALLISFGESRCAPGLCHDLPQKYPQLHEFFAIGEMHTALLMDPINKKGSVKVKPTVMIPLTEMLELAMPVETCKVESLSQFNMAENTFSDRNLNVLPQEQVFIHAIESEYLVLKSMMRPKRLTLRSADGRKFQIMCKPQDELRKDSRFMDVNRMMNSLMKQNADARRRQLMVRTFTVIPLQANGGILEWVPNLMPYREVLKPLCTEYSGNELDDKHWFSAWPKEGPIEEKIEKFRSYFYTNYPLVMSEWFRRQFVDAANWHIARNKFSRSAAVMSMIGFVLGLGDRHGENVLIDLNDGAVVHVDYNLIFNKGEQLPVKEVVPFRLTRNMINGMGPTGVEGVFRKASESTLHVMRQNKDTLLTLIHTFVHDPLLEWVNADSKAQQNKMNRQQVLKSSQALNLANDAVSFIDKRLCGHIVTPDVFKSLFNTTPMSIEGQVGKLIEIASDERMLAQMYIGWAPFI